MRVCEWELHNIKQGDISTKRTNVFETNKDQIRLLEYEIGSLRQKGVNFRILKNFHLIPLDFRDYFVMLS